MTFTGPFEVGPGWMDICRATVERLEPAGAHIVQVKEKFGGLRIYWDLDQSSGIAWSEEFYEKIEKMVREAELVASWTCMECGKVKSDVKIRSSMTGWLVGYCQECLDEWNAELVNQGRVNRPEEESNHE